MNVTIPSSLATEPGPTLLKLTPLNVGLKMASVGALGSVLGSPHLMMYGFAMAFGRDRMCLHTGILSAVLNIILSVLLAGHYGCYGISIGTSISLFAGTLFYIINLLTHKLLLIMAASLLIVSPTLNSSKNSLKVIVNSMQSK